MHHARRSIRGLILSLLSLVALVGAVTLGVSLQQHASQAHAAGAGVASGPPLIGTNQHYLALGDSLAFGQQPNCVPPAVPVPDCTHGYVNDLFQILQGEGVQDFTNLGCPSESSTTFISGTDCGFANGKSQLTAAVDFLKANAGKVSIVTLDIGANDMLPDLLGCTPLGSFSTDLTTLDSNLTGTILPAIYKALTPKGFITSRILMMNYYNPFPNCATNPQFVQDFNTFNAHLAADVSGFGTIVDVLGAFGGIAPSNICDLIWICPPPLGVGDIHPKDLGYTTIADAFAAVIPDN